MMLANDKKQLFDCVITCGERDPKCYGQYKEGTITREVVKHNVTQEEAQEWHGSPECLKRVHELVTLGREKFGKDLWLKWDVNFFWTTAAKDQS